MLRNNFPPTQRTGKSPLRNIRNNKDKGNNDTKPSEYFQNLISTLLTENNPATRTTTKTSINNGGAALFSAPKPDDYTRLRELKKNNAFLNTTTLVNALKLLKGEYDNTVDVEKAIKFLHSHNKHLKNCSKELLEQTINYFNNKILVKHDKILGKYAELSEYSDIRKQYKYILDQIIAIGKTENQSPVANKHYTKTTTTTQPGTTENLNIATKRKHETETNTPQNQRLLKRSRSFYNLPPQEVLKLFGGNVTSLSPTNTTTKTSKKEKPAE